MVIIGLIIEAPISTSLRQIWRSCLVIIPSVAALALSRAALASTPAAFWQGAQSSVPAIPDASVIQLEETGVEPDSILPSTGEDESEDASQWSASAVALKTEASLPVTGLLGFEAAPGQSELNGTWNADGTWSQPFDTTQTFSYAMDHQVDGRSDQNAISDLLTLGNGSQLLLSGQFESADPVGALKEGYSDQGSAAYTGHTGRWDNHLEFSIASTDMGLAFNSTDFTPAAATNNDISIACTEVESDGEGQTTLAYSLVVGHEYGVASLAVPMFPAVGSEYGYDRLSVSREFTLQGGFGLATTLSTQMAHGILFDSARMGIGDLLGIATLDTDFSPYSAGVLAGQEITTPAADLGMVTGMQSLTGDTLRASIFWNYADPWQSRMAEEEAAVARMASAGIDLDYSALSKMNFNVHLGWQALRTAQSAQQGPFGQMAFSFDF